MTDISVLIGVTDASSLGMLSPAFKVVQRMTDTYRHIKLGRKRCKIVIQQAAVIVKEVHGNLQRGQLSVPDVTKLQRKFEDVQSILQAIADMSFLKALLHFEDVNKRIERASSHLTECSQLFPMISLSSHVQAQGKAALSDRDALRALLKIVAGNYEEIRRRFGIYSDEQEDQAMAVMERELRNARVASEEDMPVEMQIMQKSLECIKTTTGRSAPKQNKWLITEYDLEYCGTIGGGGFATVSKARFRYTTVAVKTFKDAGNMREILEREVEIWSKLHHDHIVPFYGASTLTSPPFIVSRYMQNGNLVQYLTSNPDVDRTKLIFEVSLGMYYLHEESVIHGDLKGVNVLVDDSGKACITDFGLSKVYSSGTTGAEMSKIAGTLRFLAPEALKGEPLSFESDVYAFGMLIYEVFTGEVPFIREPDNLIIEDRVELDRPTSSKVSERGFNDELWKLLSDCKSRKPSARPRFKTIQACLDSLKRPDALAQSVLPDPMLGTENERMTVWTFDTQPSVNPSATLLNSAEPLLKQSKSVSGGQPGLVSRRTIPYDFRTFPPTFPTCIEVTNKYLGVTFGISSREPGVYLPEANTFQWQPIRAKKKSLLYEEGNKFYYRNIAGSGHNSWEWSGTDVTLRSLSSTGVCRFRDPLMAQRWYRLQLGYARDGSVGDWGTAVGDWSHTEQSWRRLVSGKLQQADLVDGGSNTVPSDNIWTDIILPKRCVIDDYAGNENCIVCTTNPGKQPGRLCCQLEVCKIVFETYRRQGDKEPMTAREETYPSEEYARATFQVLKSFLVKTAEKGTKTILFSF